MTHYAIIKITKNTLTLDKVRLLLLITTFIIKLNILSYYLRGIFLRGYFSLGIFLRKYFCLGIFYRGTIIKLLLLITYNIDKSKNQKTIFSLKLYAVINNQFSTNLLSNE